LRLSSIFKFAQPNPKNTKLSHLTNQKTKRLTSKMYNVSAT
jgi:hypothetical protein